MLAGVITGLIQGITEFLPISSSGHLLIYHKFVGQAQDSLALDAVLHLATALALVIYFRKEWVNMFNKWRTDKLLRYIIAGSAPAALAGILLEGLIKNIFRDVNVVILMLILIGILMLYADKYFIGKDRLKKLTFNKALFVGILQVLALIPGTSRSGITILAGMKQGLSRKEAARFAFLLGAPITFGAGIVSLPDLVKVNYDLNGVIIAFTTAFFSGLAAISFMLKFLENKPLKLFAVYRIILGALIFIVNLTQ